MERTRADPSIFWGYGIGWGAVYVLLAGTTRRSQPVDGVLFGTGVWVMSYVQLVPMGFTNRLGTTRPANWRSTCPTTWPTEWECPAVHAGQLER